jgi:hypothetical protein
LVAAFVSAFGIPVAARWLLGDAAGPCAAAAALGAVAAFAVLAPAQGSMPLVVAGLFGSATLFVARLANPDVALLVLPCAAIGALAAAPTAVVFAAFAGERPDALAAAPAADSASHASAESSLRALVRGGAERFARVAAFTAGTAVAAGLLAMVGTERCAAWSAAGHQPLAWPELRAACAAAAVLPVHAAFDEPAAIFGALVGLVLTRAHREAPRRAALVALAAPALLAVAARLAGVEGPAALFGLTVGAALGAVFVPEALAIVAVTAAGALLAAPLAV